MRQEAEAYIKWLDEQKIRHDDIYVLSSGKFDVETRWGLGETNVAIRAIFDHDGHTVGIRCYRLAHIKESVFSDVLKTCNELNNRYRWCKFTVDKDYDINVEIDCIVNENTAGEVVLELVQRLCNIVDKAYPELMNAIYGCKQGDSKPIQKLTDKLRNIF